MFSYCKANKHRILSMFSALLLFLSLGSMVASAEGSVGSGTTYYISDSLGNDENSGTSEAAPWKTVERLSQVSLTAGDTVLFKSGDVWYGSWELDVSGGEQNDPITFSSYGEGAKPSLRFYTGTVTQTAEGICLTLLNANGFVMDGLDIGYANLGIKLYYDAEHYESDYVRFSGCHFHDIYGVTQLDGLENIYVSACITTDLEVQTFETEGDDAGNGWALRGLYIDNCTANDAGTLVCGPVGVFGFYMKNCMTENNGYYGTTAFGCRNGYIDRCIFRNNGSRDMPAGSCGIMLGADDFTVKNSIIAGQQRQGSDPDGCGIDFEWKCHNVTIENCLFQENAGVGVMYFTSGNGAIGTNYNTHILNCYFIDNNTNIGNVGGFDIFSTSYGAAECRVSGNKYLVTDFKKSETIDFCMLLDNNDITLENNTEMDSVPDNLEAMILNPELAAQSSASMEHEPNVLIYCVIAALSAIVISVVLWIIIAKVRKK